MKDWALRCLDVLISLVVVVALSPVFIVVGVVIRLTSGSGVLFRQERLGADMEPFILLKFRTMVPDEMGGWDPIGDVARTTPVGRFLRRTSLDELPSFWNVLSGEMSVVGPRPLPTLYRDRFLPHERARFAVLPGITGLAQVGGRNSIGWEERFALDLAWVRDRSVRLYLVIVLKSVRAALTGRAVNATSDLTMAPLDPDRASGSIAVESATEHEMGPG